MYCTPALSKMGQAAAYIYRVHVELMLLVQPLTKIAYSKFRQLTKFPRMQCKKNGENYVHAVQKMAITPHKQFKKWRKFRSCSSNPDNCIFQQVPFVWHQLFRVF